MTAPTTPRMEDTPPLRSVHTSNFATLLEEFDICGGVQVVNVETGQIVAYVEFGDAVQEIFAVQVLPGVRHPDVINDLPYLSADSFVLPDEALNLVPGPFCQRV